MVVVGPQAPPASAATAGRLTVVDEIEPAAFKGRSTLVRLPQLPGLSRAGKGPFGSGSSQVVTHPLGPLVQLAPGSRSGEVPWEAYTLSINRPGEPHVLEVDFPSDVPQTLGISIVEPNAAGAVVPFQLDSGVDLAEEVTGTALPAQWLRHRLVFWPRTKTPIVLLTNRRDKSPAAFGKIRVLAGWQQLPRAFPAAGPKPQRLWLASLDRPLFAANFSASEALGASGDLSAADWLTFYEGGTRLVQYLNYAGYNGLMLTAMADSSTIYPTQAATSTPRYDTGTYLTTGQDPIRKDVLELLFRLFDREGLQLVPAVEFAGPMPELDAVLRRGGPEADGLAWIGADGLAWQQVHAPRDGKAPYYNVLHPRVQEAMLKVVRELAANYAEHPAFGGLTLRLSPDGFSQLPGPEWGLDDTTMARFEADTQLHVHGAGPNRFAQREAALCYEGPDGQREWRREWLQWRATQLTAVLPTRPGGVDRGPARDTALSCRRRTARRRCLGPKASPLAAARTTMADALLSVGIDARQYGPNDGIVLLRPERVVPHASLAARAIDLEIDQLPDVDQYFERLSPSGSVFFHVPQEAGLASFDEKCPVQPCHTSLATEAVPAAWQNRRRLAHSLATLDAQVVVDGGWLLPMGQEESLRPLVAVFRQLPAMRMERIADLAPGEYTGGSGSGSGRRADSGQTVTVRSGSRGDRTYVYVVNDASFSATVRLRVEAPAGCDMHELTGAGRSRPWAATPTGPIGTWSLGRMTPWPVGCRPAASASRGPR